MTLAGGLTVIGENINATRKIKATSPRVVSENGHTGIAYADIDGQRRLLDCTDIIPVDPTRRAIFMIPHVAQALRRRNKDYLIALVRAQERAGAQIIDLCVDEMSPETAERQTWMRWLVRLAQSASDAIFSIDSSDAETIRAGLEAYDRAKSRPAINSYNLEEGREALLSLASEFNALLFANASGRDGMPQDAEGRVANLRAAMAQMDAHGIPMSDRYLDPLVFPVGAGPDYGRHYLDAVRTLRAEYPDVHLFGGHSNVSFGLPRRGSLNHAFSLLAIAAGCDAVMIDPVAEPPAPLAVFRYAAEALLGRDEYAMSYIAHCRGHA